MKNITTKTRSIAGKIAGISAAFAALFAGANASAEGTTYYFEIGDPTPWGSYGYNCWQDKFFADAATNSQYVYYMNGENKVWGTKDGKVPTAEDTFVFSEGYSTRYFMTMRGLTLSEIRTEGNTVHAFTLGRGTYTFDKIESARAADTNLNLTAYNGANTLKVGNANLNRIFLGELGGTTATAAANLTIDGGASSVINLRGGVEINLNNIAAAATEAKPLYQVVNLKSGSLTASSIALNATDENENVGVIFTLSGGSSLTLRNGINWKATLSSGEITVDNATFKTPQLSSTQTNAAFNFGATMDAEGKFSANYLDTSSESGFSINGSTGSNFVLGNMKDSGGNEVAGGFTAIGGGALTINGSVAALKGVIGAKDADIILGSTATQAATWFDNASVVRLANAKSIDASAIATQLIVAKTQSIIGNGAIMTSSNGMKLLGTIATHADAAANLSITGGTLTFGADSNVVLRMFGATSHDTLTADAFDAEGMFNLVFDMSDFNIGSEKMASFNLTDLFEGADNSLFASANASMKNDNGKFDMAFDGINGTVSFTAVPEPATYAALFGLAALGFALYRRRR